MKPSMLARVCACVLLALRGAAEGLGHQVRLHPHRHSHHRGHHHHHHSLQHSQLALNASAALATVLEDQPVVTGDEARKRRERILEIEKVLISLKADKAAGRITPGMESFVNTVRTMIGKDMIPKIESGHKSAKEILASVRKGFEGCSTHRSAARTSIATLATTRTSARAAHKACRLLESKAFSTQEMCAKVVDEKERLKDTACNAVKALRKDPNDDADNCHTTDVAEPYGLWLKRNRRYFEAKHAEIQKHKGLCEQAKLQFERVQGPCNSKRVIWERRKELCDKKQVRLETAACTFAKKTFELCGSYGSCFDKQKELYELQVPLIKTQEKDRKTEWRGLKRIECLLTEVFGGSSVDQAEIDACTKKKHDTSHLDLEYPELPARDAEACQPLPPLPGSRSFASREFGKMPRSTKAAPADECVVDPGAGVRLHLAKGADKTLCSLDNDWLRATGGGSCLLAGTKGAPLEVDYTKARFTRYRFTMKMEETNSRNGVQEGGGFAVCNVLGTDSRQIGDSPAIVFQDTVPSAWGYHLMGNFFAPKESSGKKCEDLMVKYKVWGKESAGIDVSKYTDATMKWIGCNGDGCDPKSFFCTDEQDGITFGTTGTLRALLGKEVPETSDGCCSSLKTNSVCNAMDREEDVQALCESLGYTRGTIVEKGESNSCPQVTFAKNAWQLGEMSGGPGKRFRCQGPFAKGLYTAKDYYQKSEPKSSEEKSWDLVMEFQDDKYRFHSLSIEGVKFDAYKGSWTTCPTKGKDFAFAPRIVTLKNPSKVWIKDFRVFQGDDLGKPLKQIVGIGFGKDAEARQKVRELKAKKAAEKAHLLKLKRQELDEKNDPGLRNDMTKVADWVDKESLCKSQMAKRDLFGACAKAKSNRVGIWVKYKNGIEGFAAYDGVANLWNKRNFKGLDPAVSTGFFSKCKGLHFLHGGGPNLPMAWSGCKNDFSSNFDLDYSPKKCSDWRASRRGWVSARIRLYCKL